MDLCNEFLKLAKKKQFNVEPVIDLDDYKIATVSKKIKGINYTISFIVYEELGFATQLLSVVPFQKDTMALLTEINDMNKHSDYVIYLQEGIVNVKNTVIIDDDPTVLMMNLDFMTRFANDILSNAKMFLKVYR